MNTNERPLALITGASTGIGYELARQFLIHDYDVMIVAENEEIHRAAESLGFSAVSPRPDPRGRSPPGSWLWALPS
jgi:short-subunit dehydrogenase